MDAGDLRQPTAGTTAERGADPPNGGDSSPPARPLAAAGTLLGLLILVRMVQRWIVRPEEEPGPPIGLALSGGGYRSALFGLGALFYLVESGKVRRLDTIASVSGGSYTNAKAFLYPGDLRDIDTEDLIDHFGDFVRGMTKPSPLAGWVLLFPVIGGIAAAIWWQWEDGWVRLVLTLVLVAVLAVAVPVWGRISAGWIWRRLFGRETRKVPLSPDRDPVEVAEVSRWGRERDTPYVRESAQAKARARGPGVNTVHHVICAAEINFKEFVYFTNRLVAHRRFGRGSAAEYTVKRAVDASAALPPVFAPIPLRTKPFRWAPQDTPSRVLCVDGGVHDTLATEWFRPGDWDEIEVRRIGREHLWRGGEVIVVNGSAPTHDQRSLGGQIGRFRVPVVWWWKAHRRTLKLAFSNWDRRNYKQLNRTMEDRLPASRAGTDRPTDFTGISVAENPYHGEYSAELSPQQRAQLSARPVLWKELVETTEKVSAIPGRLERDQIVSLLYQGYALTWRVLEGQDQRRSDDEYTLLSIEEVAQLWFGDGAVRL